MIVEPIKDEDLWGTPTGNSHADYWPFGHLLVRFQELAERNGIVWPLHAPWEWRNINNVKEAMEDVFRRLPAPDKDGIRAEYETFLRLDNAFDWVEMAEFKEPEVVVPGWRYLKALEAEEEEKKRLATENTEASEKINH